MRDLFKEDPGCVVSLPASAGGAQFSAEPHCAQRERQAQAPQAPAAQADGRAYDEAPVAPHVGAVEHLVFFSILMPKPSLIRRPAHGPQTMPVHQRLDMVVSALDSFGSASEPVIASVTLTSDRMHTCTLTNLASRPESTLLEAAHQWKRVGPIQYALPGLGPAFTSSWVSYCLRRMLDCSALPLAIDGYHCQGAKRASSAR